MGIKDDKKKLIGEYLKAADRLIQTSEFTQAMIEVKKALTLEPGNMYALAYNQRIKAALESLKKKEEAARLRKITEEKKSAQAPAPAAKPAGTPGDEAAPVREAPPAASAAAQEEDRYTIKQQQVQIERFKEEVESLRLKHQQEIAVLAEELRQVRADRKEVDEKYQSLVDDAEESHRRVEELYAEVVRLNGAKREPAAEDNAIDAVSRESLLRDVVGHLLLADTLSAEANDVMELIRTRLGFDDDAFVQLQMSVKTGLYKDALEQAWTDGYITPERSENLAELRKKIGISAEDHFEIEAELRRAKKKR